MRARPQRLRRVVSCALGAVAAAFAVCDASCGGGGNGTADGGFDAATGMVVGVPACCVVTTYLELPAAECPFVTCNGPNAYALCTGTYSECTCDPPPRPWRKVEIDAASCEPSDAMMSLEGGSDVECFIEAGDGPNFEDVPSDAPIDGPRDGGRDAAFDGREDATDAGGGESSKG